MRRTTQYSRLFVAALAPLAFASETNAQDQAGTVIFASGQVIAERPQPVPIAKGDDVLVNDIIVTGVAARAQLQMLDGGKLAIRPESRLAIEEFVFAGEQAQSAAPVAQASNERSVMNLLKGGFRTITGIIGESDEEAYEVRTPVGSLGIRGTDYAALYCLSDCLFAPGVEPGQAPEDGLYLSVTDGIVAFTNELIQIEIEAGQFVFIPLTDRLPQFLDVPPPVLLDIFDVGITDPAGVAQNSDPRTRGFGTAGLAARRDAPSTVFAAVAGQTDGGGDPSSAFPGTGAPSGGVPALSILAIDPDGNSVDLTSGSGPQPGNRVFGFATGPLGPDPSPPYGATRENLPAEYVLDASNNLIEFVGGYVSRTAPMTDAVFEIGSASNVDVGFDSVTMLRWGRWSGGTVAVMLANGMDASQDMANQSLHWISGPEGQAPVMPMMGNASYSLIGGTSPTDNFGNTGVLASATFTADFTNMTVTNSLDLTIGGSQWTAIGDVPIGGIDPPNPAHLFGGAYQTVSIDGVASGSGLLSGFFSGPGSIDPTLPGGAGLTYALTDMTQTTQVSGALVFGNPN